MAKHILSTFRMRTEHHCMFGSHSVVIAAALVNLTRVVLDKAAVEVTQLFTRNVSRGVIGGLEVQVVLSITEEL